MAELLKDSQSLESTTVGIYRTATVVKGGRRFSFAALVVVGNRRGSVGIGYGKAPGVPAAIEKAQKDAKKKLFSVTLKGGTLPHPVTGRFSASKVRLVPAAPGTGVIAGGTARAVLEMVGVNDCLTKAYGSTNQKNLCKAVIEGLQQLRNREEIAALRGVELGKSEVELKVEAGLKYMPQAKPEAPAKAPKPKSKSKKSKGGKAEPAAPETAAPETAAPEAEAAQTTEAQPPEAAPAPEAAQDQNPEAGSSDSSERPAS